MYSTAKAITPSNTDNLAMGTTEAIWCTGEAGNVVCVFEDGTSLTLPIATGFANRLCLRVKRVNETNTTATGLVGLK